MPEALPALAVASNEHHPSLEVVAEFMALPDDLQQQVVEELDDGHLARLRWLVSARPNQLTPDEHALCWAEDCEAVKADAHREYPLSLQGEQRDAYCVNHGHIAWNIWLLLAGRGFGKTRSGAEDTADYLINNKNVRVALIAPTFADGRDTMVEGESGLKALIPKSLVENWNRSLGELVLKNGSRARIFSAEAPERLRGPQHHRAWCDELASWQYLQRTWDMMMFGLRLGPHPQVVITTTPKPYRFLRKLLAESAVPARGRTVISSGSTFENRAHLPSIVLSKLDETYANTRLGRQELYAEVLDDLGEGVVKLADIEHGRKEAWQIQDVAGARQWADLFDRIVVAIDPAVTARKTSDETGIAVCGRTAGACPFCTYEENPRRLAHAVVLESWGGRVSDAEWALKALELYRKWQADRVVAEVNNGGDLVETVLHGVSESLPVKQVRASRGKVIRAEPIGAMYERHIIHHFGVFPILEDQLCNLGLEVDEPDPDAETSESPDRADAAVWGLTELMVPDAAVSTVIASEDTRGASDRGQVPNLLRSDGRPDLDALRRLSSR